LFFRKHFWPEIGFSCSKMHQFYEISPECKSFFKETLKILKIFEVYKKYAKNLTSEMF
jgi:hypothetical protein